MTEQPSTELVPVQASTATELQARMTFAKAMATAGILPAAYRNQPGNLLLADQYARDLGLPFTTILTGIHVIEGKPSASAGLISGLVRRAGHRLRIAVGRDTNGRAVSATATIIRSDDPDFAFTATFTLADAVTAGLCTLEKDGRPRARSDRGKVLPWEAYTEAMLKARATTAVARDACQEVLLGVQYTPEELGAVVDEEGAPVGAPVAAPRPVVHEPAPPAPVVDAEVVDETTGEIDDAGWPAYDDPVQEPTPPAPSGDLTQKQLGTIGRLFTERGITDRDEALAIVEEAIGRRVDSRKDLSKSEASRLIDYLMGGGK